MKIKYKTTIALAKIVSLLPLTLTPFDLHVAHCQDEDPLPELLIHGYNTDASVWNGRLNQLNNIGLYTEAVTFDEDDPEYDACGSSAYHATDLNQIVKELKSRTHAERINLAANSKGELEERVFLANNFANDDVANLIMIGTPNRGSPVS